MYRVHIGYTRAGRNRWRYFPTLGLARKLANEIFRGTGIVVAIERAPE